MSLYSENDEEALLWFLISRLSPPVSNELFYLEIGAGHPKWMSNTYLLYRLGFSGVVVDANPSFCEQLRSVRPRDIVVNAAVGDYEGTVRFKLAGFFSKLIAGTSDEFCASDHIELKCVALDELLKEQGINSPSFKIMLIDVEGEEISLLKSFVTTGLKPSLVIVEFHQYGGTDEATEAASDAVLHDYGYKKLYVCGRSGFYVADRCEAVPLHLAVATGSDLLAAELERIGCPSGEPTSEFGVFHREPAYVPALWFAKAQGRSHLFSRDIYICWIPNNIRERHSELAEVPAALLRQNSFGEVISYLLSTEEYAVIKNEIIERVRENVLSQLHTADVECLSDKHKKHFSQLAQAEVRTDSNGLLLDQEYAMFSAEGPLMSRHADLLLDGQTNPSLLEIGFGLGVFTRYGARKSVKSYTVIELHPQLALEALQYIAEHVPDQATITTMVAGPWQLALEGLGRFDAVMCDTCPPSGHGDKDFEMLVSRLTRDHLTENGRFSFFWSGRCISPFRRKILEKFFHNVHFENMTLENLPPCWTKETPEFVLSVGSKPKYFGVNNGK